MSWGYVAVGAATVISGAMQSRSQRRAADAAGSGADAATAESARQYDQTRADLAPYRTTGTGALNQIARLMGLPTEAQGGYFDPQLYLQQNPDLAANDWASANPNEHWENFGRFEGRQSPWVGGTPASPGGAPDMSGFFASPDYNFRRTEGMRGLERSAAASGGAFSGNALRALSEFNSNLASQEYGNYFNRLANVAGIGQTATNQTANYGAEHANNAGRNAVYGGNARASGIVGQGAAWGNTLNDLAGLYGSWSRNNQLNKEQSANGFSMGFMRDLGL